MRDLKLKKITKKSTSNLLEVETQNATCQNQNVICFHLFHIIYFELKMSFTCNRSISTINNI